MLYIGSDHAGFLLKSFIIAYCEKHRIAFEDCGAFELDEKDDYPGYAYTVAKKVASGGARDRGVLICGNGVGVCMVANKVNGIRAATGFSTYAARTSRTDDNANVLCIAARVMKRDEALKIVHTFLETPFSQAARHKRRLDQVRVIENKEKK